MSMFKLPTSDGGTSVLWSGESYGIRERIRVVCHGSGSWTMVTECCEDQDSDEWVSAGVSLDGLRACWTGLVIALRDRTTVAGQFVAALCKGKTQVPTGPKPIKFARVTGGGRWWASWKCECEDQAGTPSISIEFSRPLDADELVCAIRQMCKAFDAWDKEH